MFGESELTTQPAFYFFVFATMLLSVGFFRGRRRNQRIVASALKALEAVFEPKDQEFTNIGGLTGYHATFIPKRTRYVKKIDATITLLPRHSWLYLPISKVIRRFDRMFIVFHLAPKAVGVLKEGHLIEKSYSTFAGTRIVNVDSMEKETITWDNRTFYLYSETPEIRAALLACKERLGEVGTLRHIALVPEQDRLFLFAIPKLGTVKPTVGTIFDWFVEFMETATR